MTKTVVGLLLVGLLMAPSVLGAADYRSMTDEQLQQQRTTMSAMSPDERQAFSEEWYRRYQRQPLQEQMRMREERFGMAPGETTGEMMRQPLPPPGQQQPMSRPSGTMSQSSPSTMSSGQSGAMMGSSQADMGTAPPSGMRDPRTMSNAELNRMMSPENSSKLSPGERAEVRQEFESRIQTFTPEERQRYLLGSSK